MSDPGTSYRTREEVQEVRSSRDPITQFKEKIINSGLLTADEVKKFDSEIKAKVDVATKEAKSDKEIEVKELFTDVYATNIEPLIRGILPKDQHTHNTLNHVRNK